MKRNLVFSGIAGVLMIVSMGFATGALATGPNKVDLAKFTVVEVTQGIVANVVCGEGNFVNVYAPQEVFEKMKVNIDGEVLKISRGFNVGTYVKHRKEGIRVTVTTNAPLSAVVASSGAELKVEACAVDPEELGARVKSGADVIVAGVTRFLNLRAGMGGTFNAAFHASDLRVERAIVKISGRAEMGICAAGMIEGKASTGAEIRTSKETELRVKLGTGAEVSHVGC